MLLNCRGTNVVNVKITEYYFTRHISLKLKRNIHTVCFDGLGCFAGAGEIILASLCKLMKSFFIRHDTRLNLLKRVSNARLKIYGTLQRPSYYIDGQKGKEIPGLSPYVTDSGWSGELVKGYHISSDVYTSIL
jgi:hypothetical protein